jgi:hypothetical protein
MIYYLILIAVTIILIAVTSEITKRSSFAGTLLTSGIKL